MKFDPIGQQARAEDELPVLPLHADAVFVPYDTPRWFPALMLASLAFYPLVGWAIYALIW